MRVLDNFSSGRRENLAGLGARVDVVEGDIRNAVACRKACGGANFVFHLAAFISVPGSLKDPVTADAINITGTLNLLLAARDSGARRFVFSSSSAVYGDTEVLPTPEDVLPRPLSPYGAEKLYGEHLCRIFTLNYGLQAVALRYFNVYGPGQNPESEYAAVIPKFITRLLEGKTPTIFGDGTQTRDFLYVGDVVQANLLAAQVEGAAGGVYNVAGGRAISLSELAQELARVTGTGTLPEHGPERQGDIKHSSADIRRAIKALGFRPQYELARGLEQTVAYYREAAARAASEGTSPEQAPTYSHGPRRSGPVRRSRAPGGREGRR